MALTLEQKKTIVAEVADVAANAHSAVVAEYRGLTVGEMAKLRVNARAAGVYLRVVKNTLARQAVNDTDFVCMQGALVGPVILAFSQTDPGAAARVIGDFAKEHSKLVATKAAIGGQLLDASEISWLAKLPTYEQAISMLMAVIKAPLDKFARTLAEPHGKLVRTIAAIRDQKDVV